MMDWQSSSGMLLGLLGLASACSSTTKVDEAQTGNAWGGAAGSEEASGVATGSADGSGATGTAGDSSGGAAEPAAGAPSGASGTQGQVDGDAGHGGVGASGGSGTGASVAVGGGGVAVGATGGALTVGGTTGAGGDGGTTGGAVAGGVGGAGGVGAGGSGGVGAGGSGGVGAGGSGGVSAGGSGGVGAASGAAGMDTRPTVGWQAMVRLGQDDESNYDSERQPVAVVTPSGDAVVVMHEYASGLWARHYRAASDAWEPLFKVNAGTEGSSPRAGADGEGNVIVAWAAQGGFSTRWLRSSAVWDEESSTDFPLGMGVSLRDMVVTPEGFVVLVAESSASGQGGAVIQLLDPERGWLDPVTLSTSGHVLGDVQGAATLLGSTLRVIVIWTEDRDEDDIRVARGAVYDYDSDTGVGAARAPVALEGDVTLSTSVQDVVMDAAGNALATLLQDSATGARDHVLVNRYGASGWSGATSLTPNGSSLGCRVAITPGGDALLVYNEVSPLTLWSRRYVGGAWQPAELVAEATGESWLSPALSLDGRGHGLAIWSDHSAALESVFASEFDPATGWSTPHLLETDNTNVYGEAASLAANESGLALGVWIRTAKLSPLADERRTVFGARFVP